MSAQILGTTTTPSPARPRKARLPAFQRIAVCLESIEELPGVVAAIRALAAGSSARALVLHLNPTALTAAVFPESASRRDVESDAEARALVEEAVRRMRQHEVDATGQVVASGWQTAAGLLLGAAAGFQSDLIVAVPRGLTGLPALISGGVSHALLERAPCPVLCLPPGLQRVDLRYLVVAWDGSPAARAALRLARRLSDEFGSQVTRLRVSPKARLRRSGERRALTPVQVIERGTDTVAEALNRGAAAAGAGVILIGGHRRGDFAALLLGSVTHGLLAISERPVLVARGR
jgi:nucleotide-binding universal stress UspA family protein